MYSVRWADEAGIQESPPTRYFTNAVIRATEIAMAHARSTIYCNGQPLYDLALRNGHVMVLDKYAAPTIAAAIMASERDDEEEAENEDDPAAHLVADSSCAITGGTLTGRVMGRGIDIVQVAIPTGSFSEFRVRLNEALACPQCVPTYQVLAVPDASVEAGLQLLALIEHRHPA